jgi:hypothetical protein
VKYDSKGLAAKPQEPLHPFSFFRTHLLTDTLHHQQDNRVSPEVQGFRVTVGWIAFLRGEAGSESYPPG